MRNLNQELEDIGLDPLQRKTVLNWINTLSSKDLDGNGNENLYFPPGYGDVTPPDPDGIDRSLPYHVQDQLREEKRIQNWIDESMPEFRKMEGIVSGRIYFIKELRKKFSWLSLKEAKDHLLKNW